MKSKAISIILSLTLVAGLFVAVHSMADNPQKDHFRVWKGTLYRGDSDFTIKAFWVPDLGSSGGTLDKMVPAMARIAEAGGNTVCFDLWGFNEKGTAIDPLGVETVKTIAQRGKDQRMGVLVRVLAGVGDDSRVRRNAVRTASKVFAEEGKALYWIDGPDAARLVKSFKKKARNAVVVSPEGGDLSVSETAPAPPPAPDSEEPAPELKPAPVLVLDHIPDFEANPFHFVLSGDDEDYPALDAALMTPVEKAPWTPDNAVLSEAERAEGFIALFDGKTLDGWWIKDDNQDCFHVSEEGYIEWLSGGGGALMTRDRYDNFILRLEWKILPGGNSGVWMRAPRDARQSKIGMEFQIQGDSDVEEPDKSNTGAVYDVLPPLAMAARPEGLWNTFEAVFDGAHFKATVNGVLVQEVNFEEHEELRYRLRKGFICLTDHGNYVAYRNIRLKRL